MLPILGSGVFEIRVHGREGAFRVVYIASLPGAIYVLHAFQKKTRKTPRLDLELARIRLAELMRSIE
jgi:phage-related protein